MSSLLFSHTCLLCLDPDQQEAAAPYAPLDALHAAARMRALGHRAALYDTTFSHSTDEVWAPLVALRPDMLVICNNSTLQPSQAYLNRVRTAAFSLCRLAREMGCKVVVSATDAATHYEQYLQEGADFVLTGETDIILPELVAAVSRQQRLSGISGLAFMHQGQVIKTALRSVTPAAALPVPAWDLLDMAAYRRRWLKHAGYFSVNIRAARGGARTPQQVVQEIKYLHRHFNVDHIWFCDAVFGPQPGWVHAFAGLVQQERLSFSFRIQSRPGLLLQEHYVAALASAGCESIWMEVASGSQKIQQALNSGTTIEQIRSATRLLKAHSIHPSFFVQFGHPGETQEDIEKTIALLNELQPAGIQISLLQPLPPASLPAGYQPPAAYTYPQPLHNAFAYVKKQLTLAIQAVTCAFRNALAGYTHNTIWRKRLPVKGRSRLSAEDMAS